MLVRPSSTCGRDRDEQTGPDDAKILLDPFDRGIHEIDPAELAKHGVHRKIAEFIDELVYLERFGAADVGKEGARTRASSPPVLGRIRC